MKWLNSLRKDVDFRHLIKNSSWVMGADGIGLLIGFIQGPLVARTLGIEYYGILSIVMTFVGVINQLTSFRAQEFVIKYVSEALTENNKEKVAGIVKTSLIFEAGSSLLAFVVVVLLARLAASLFVHDANSITLIYAYAIVTLSNPVSETTLGILHAFNNFQPQSYVSILSRIINLAGIVIAFLLKYGIWGILITYLLSNFISSLLSLVISWKLLKDNAGSKWWLTPLSVLNGQWRILTKFAININLNSSIALITRDADILWLGYFRGPMEAGYYKLAWSLASYLIMPLNGPGKAIYPAMARAVAGNEWRQFRRIALQGTFMASLYLVPIGIIFTLFSPTLIGLLYGSSFISAIPAPAILFLGLGWASIFFWSKPALLALGLTDYMVIMNAIVALIKTLSVFVIISKFGFMGNAILVASLYFLAVGMQVWKVNSAVEKKLLVNI